MSTRARSLWAWGWQDKLPDEDARKVMAQHVAALLGGAPLELRPLPDQSTIRVGRSRLGIPSELVGFTSADTGVRASRAYGKGYPDLVRGFAGDFGCAPDLVARPTNEDQIDALLAWCSDEDVAVIPYGGGTSVVGGVEPRTGDLPSITLDLGAFDKVLEVDAVSRAARIQAGTLGPALEAQLQPHGLTLRHFPQSFEFSTLGGWIATRAGGHFATVYTHIDDLVESIRMVTPRGLWQSRRLPASGAGPSPDRLALGSEGILGVITEAWMRVQPRPRWRAQASVHFAEFNAAVDAVRAISQSGLFPSNCRLLNPHEALINRVAFDGSTVVLLAFESADHALNGWLERALAICAEHRGTCPKGPAYKDEGAKSEGGDAAASWKAAFIDAPYLQSALVTLGVIADTFETACTWDRFPSLHASVKQAMEEALRRVCGGGLVSCRFTHVYPDGPAPYYTFIGRARLGAELEQWAELKRAAGDALSAAGATITHHHAVGRVHRPWYDRERPEPFALALRAAKHALDPAGILNPGVLL